MRPRANTRLQRSPLPVGALIEWHNHVWRVIGRFWGRRFERYLLQQTDGRGRTEVRCEALSQMGFRRLV